MSFVLRLNLVVLVLFLILISAIFYRALVVTADHIQQEENLNFTLADELIVAQIQLLATYPYIEVRPEKLPILFDLTQFSDNQYLTIRLYKADGELISESKQDDQSSTMPALIKQLLSSSFEPEQSITHPISFGDMYLGEIHIRADRHTTVETLWSALINRVTPTIVSMLLIMLLTTTLAMLIIKPVAEFLRTNELEPKHSKKRSVYSKLKDLLGFSDHLQGISNTLTDSKQKVELLSHKIVHLQEDERRRLSAELHDELGQHLTAIRFESAAIQSARNLDEARQSATAIDSVGREMRDIVKSMLERLRPPSIETMGLKGAITEMIADWRLRHPDNTVNFFCDIDVINELDDTQKLSLYRIIQEALTNVSRHAGESLIEVTILLSLEEREIILNVEDNGRGCDLHQQTTGYGLRGMKERVEGLGGTIQIDSAPEQGMRVMANLPISYEKIV